MENLKKETIISIVLGILMAISLIAVIFSVPFNLQESIKEVQESINEAGSESAAGGIAGAVGGVFVVFALLIVAYLPLAVIFVISVPTFIISMRRRNHEIAKIRNINRVYVGLSVVFMIYVVIKVILYRGGIA